MYRPDPARTSAYGIAAAGRLKPPRYTRDLTMNVDTR